MRIPWSRRGTRAASTHFVKVRGDNARPNRRTQYWFALPPKANLRNLLWHGMRDMWKYASLRSIVTNQSSDLICGTICLKVNILNLSCMTESFRPRRSKRGRNPPSFFGTMKYQLQTQFPCLSEAHIIWSLSLTEDSLLVSLPEPAGGPPWWKTPP